MDIAYASLRIGGGTSIIDNFHGGGMVAVADLKTGELVTDGADMAGNVYKTHPMTGIMIKGF
ncbi:sugar-transfer associated ATP-grasp domain-containing protein, partial [Acinetobacter baumannii]|nr:sugar-transfer associated ATP-grasp domain-containing protein [Acinetobacter baumannii]